jgi:pimeloyl-ACP methyl ester carboxylesterase
MKKIIQHPCCQRLVLATFLFLGADLLPLSSGQAGKTAPFAPEPYYAPEQYLFLDGARICYLDSGGAGPALVLIHGWAGNCWNWMSVYHELAQENRVIALDLPGHGKSECPGGFTFTMPALADFVVRVMDELKVEKASLVGSSMGGAVAAWIAINHASRVDRLILVGAAGTSVQNPLMKAAGGLMTESSVIPLIHFAFPVNDRTLARVPLSEQKRVILAEHLYQSDRKKCASRALVRTMRSLGRDLTDHHLANIAAKTLVIWGSDDDLLPLAAGEIYSQNIPHARLVIIAGGNHTPMQWQPQAFLSEVKSFMKE